MAELFQTLLSVTAGPFRRQRTKQECLRDHSKKRRQCEDIKKGAKAMISKHGCHWEDIKIVRNQIYPKKDAKATIIRKGCQYKDTKNEMSKRRGRSNILYPGDVAVLERPLSRHHHGVVDRWHKACLPVVPVGVRTDGAVTTSGCGLLGLPISLIIQPLKTNSTHLFV